MIIDRLKNAALYSADARLARAFEYLAAKDFSQMEPGRYEIDGAKLFALVQWNETKPAETAKFEVHRKYIDVQYVVQGVERMGYAHVESLRPATPFDAEKDFMLLEGKGDFVTVPAETMVVFFPEDAHMPGIMTGPRPESVRKVVVKVAM